MFCFCITVFNVCFYSQSVSRQQEVNSAYSGGEFFYAEAGGKLNWTCFYYFISILSRVFFVMSLDALSRVSPGHSK